MTALDLSLWKDRELLDRQNDLKNQFWALFTDVGNRLTEGKLSEVHFQHSGLKLSQGNELKGYPYHVLDVLRNFDVKTGLNIRALNWFGNGMYLFLYAGLEKAELIKEVLFENGYVFGEGSDAFDFSGFINEGKNTLTIKPRLYQDRLNVWFIELSIVPELKNNSLLIQDKVEKLLDILISTVD